MTLNTTTVRVGFKSVMCSVESNSLDFSIFILIIYQSQITQSFCFLTLYLVVKISINCCYKERNPLVTLTEV